jgi:hypothetical protein
MLLFSALIVISNTGLLATNSRVGPRGTPTPNNPNDYIWGQDIVISEPLKNSNLNIGDSDRPAIAVENDKVYVVWEDENDTNGAGTDWDIFYQYYDGNQWSDVQVISEPVPGSGLNTGRSYRVDIAVENGNIYVVWRDQNNTYGAGTDSDVFYRCNLSGSGWSKVQVLSEPIFGLNTNTGISTEPNIAVDSGNIYITWQDNSNTDNAGTDYDIFYLCNLSGSGWESLQIISEPKQGSNINTGDSQDPTVTVENGNIYVIWNDWNDTYGVDTDWDVFFRCNLTGSSWETVQVISEPELIGDINGGDSYNNDIAVENGNIYVVWDDWNDTDGSGSDEDIHYRCNLTNSWEDIQVISEPSPGNNINDGSSYYPKIAVENSKIYVTWMDWSDLYLSGGEGDIFLRTNLTGSGWENEQVISEPVFGFSYNTRISTRPAIDVVTGKIHMVWQDENNTDGASTADSDIFYRTSFVSPYVAGGVIPISGNTSTMFRYEVSYFDGDNDPPTSIKVLIDNQEQTMTAETPGDINYIDGKTYYYETTLGIGNSYVYQFKTSDGMFSYIDDIMNGPIVFNTPPNITTQDNTTAIEDMKYKVNYEYEDIDVANVGQFVVWNFSSNAEWLNWNMKNQVLSGTPTNDDVGSYWVDIAVFDGMDADQTNFSLTVQAVNDPPKITTTELRAIEDTPYQKTIEASDVDTTPLTWTIDSNAAWLTISTAQHKINGTPDNDDVGDYWVYIKVDDGEYNDTKNLTLTVDNVNDPPEITTLDVLEANVGMKYSVDYDATDVDVNDVLAWSVKTNADWLSIDNITGNLSGTPETSDQGKYYVEVIVSDGNGGTDTSVFTLTVKPGLTPNQPPVITTEDVTATSVNESYNVDYEATDDRTPLNLLTWSINTNATWLNFESATGVLSGKPQTNDTGIYWVEISVGDDEGGADSTNFTLTVFLTGNEPPEITTTDVLEAEVDKKYSVDYLATDDRTPINLLDWDFESNAKWLTFEINTLSGTPKTEDIGTYWVYISVTDEELDFDFHNFTLTVKSKVEPENSEPKIKDGKMSPDSGDTDTKFKFSVTYTDEDDDEGEVYVWIDGTKHKMTPDPDDTDFTDEVTYTFNSKLDEGEHEYYFSASDGIDSASAEDDTPISSANAKNTPKIAKAEEDTGMDLILIIIFIIVLIIVALIAFMVGKRSGGPRHTPPPAHEELPELDEEYEEDLEDEETPGPKIVSPPKSPSKSPPKGPPKIVGEDAEIESEGEPADSELPEDEEMPGDEEVEEELEDEELEEKDLEEEEPVEEDLDDEDWDDDDLEEEFVADEEEKE